MKLNFTITADIAYHFIARYWLTAIGYLNFCFVEIAWNIAARIVHRNQGRGCISDI